ncbi:MAG TPA: class I SAM-dependent methyltransferase [Flavobacteriales bacterium]|nr:class I SAM-dependent methyltransferase [Flavobacteriales bacterium]
MSYIKIAVNSMRKRGLIPTLKVIWHEYAFDSKYSINTRGRSQPNPHNVEGNNVNSGKEYQGYSYYFFKIFMKNLPVNFSESAFIDFGSGKGRVLIMAAEYKFKRVIGIEYAEDLFKESLINIRSAQFESEAIEIVNADVLDYQIPDIANVFFFFNPFDEDVMDNVLNNIDASKLKAPRDMYIVYTSPTFESCFNTRGYEKVFELNNGAKNEGIIYKL